MFINESAVLQNNFFLLLNFISKHKKIILEYVEFLSSVPVWPINYRNNYSYIRIKKTFFDCKHKRSLLVFTGRSKPTGQVAAVYLWTQTEALSSNVWNSRVHCSSILLLWTIKLIELVIVIMKSLAVNFAPDIFW